MANFDNVFFNASAFVGGLFLLEFGADRFVDHTAVIARRLGVSPTLIALLTAGAEWEELAVIVAALSQGRSSLALGNILGSSISNILGAFSLGLIFTSGEVKFDRSSKIYTALTLLFTVIFVLVLAFFKSIGKAAGGLLVTLFGIYIVSIGYYIYKGVMAAPEDDDDDSDDDDDNDDDDSDTTSVSDSSESTLKDEESASQKVIPLTPLTPFHDDNVASLESVPLTKPEESLIKSAPKIRRPPRSLTYHVFQLIAGFLALSLSGYILSHSVSSLADTFELSGTVLGMTVLSIATTLPEKFIAICSGARGQNGIVVANTAGSNIFLLTLCAGVLFLAGDVEALVKSVNTFDLLVTAASASLFAVVVFVGAKRWMAVALLVLYFAFIGVEFAIYR
ncbi:hypothetical protein MMC26_006125 [Xylographa opegraphella]|nr:hypothetical protein [Xylographa opegraphella]